MAYIFFSLDLSGCTWCTVPLTLHYTIFTLIRKKYYFFTRWHIYFFSGSVRLHLMYTPLSVVEHLGTLGVGSNLMYCLLFKCLMQLKYPIETWILNSLWDRRATLPISILLKSIYVLVIKFAENKLIYMFSFLLYHNKSTWSNTSIWIFRNWIPIYVTTPPKN